MADQVSKELEIVSELQAKHSNRRNFVRNLGIASAAVGAAAVIDPSKAEAQSGPSDFDILNFALNLEYLEAEFYTVATTGKTIDQFGITITGGSGAMGATTGGGQVTFNATDKTVQGVAQELAADEQTHVALIQNAILLNGGTYINKPAINLNALGFGFGNQNDFLKLARIFEEIGVTAYGGAANLLSNKTIVNYAARILAVEAEHVGYIRSLMRLFAVSSGPGLDPADVPPPPFGIQAFSTDSFALTLTRTPAQVLYLAYGAGSASSGGFFPAGVNGSSALTMSAATPAGFDTSTLTATPNPIPVNGAQYGQTTITWAAPTAQYIQIRVGSPTGPLFTTNFNGGSMTTGVWVSDGLVLYLQDISNGKALTANNTLAKLILRLA